MTYIPKSMWGEWCWETFENSPLPFSFQTQLNNGINMQTNIWKVFHYTIVYKWIKWKCHKFSSIMTYLNIGKSNFMLVQWLGLWLIMQGMWVWSLVRQGAGIPHDSRLKSQDIKQRQCCNKFNKDCKKKKRSNRKNLRKINKVKKIALYRHFQIMVRYSMYFLMKCQKLHIINSIYTYVCIHMI